jgi:hypothetical protein
MSAQKSFLVSLWSNVILESNVSVLKYFSLDTIFGEYTNYGLVLGPVCLPHGLYNLDYFWRII